MSKTTSPYIASLILNHLVIQYVIPNTILSDNGPNFLVDPQTNIQAKGYNRKISPSLCHHVIEHQTNWVPFVQPLTYAYNSQVHSSTGITPFNPTVPQPTPCPSLYMSSTISPNFNDYIAPSMSTMRSRILTLLSVMFDKIYELSSTAFSTFNRIHQSLQQTSPLFGEGY